MTTFNFRREGVIVITRPQISGIDLTVQRHNIPVTVSTVAVQQVFDPIDLVINLKVVNTNKPEAIVMVFDPALELRVRYRTGHYLLSGGNILKLKLGYYDGVKWIPFTVATHRFTLTPNIRSQPHLGGWGNVFIDQWPDPTVGWGR